MSISSTTLRENVYTLLDEVLRTGKPLEVRRKGRKLLIIAETPASKLGRLRPRPTLKGEAEDIVHIDWSKEWRP